jgi:hypothetical protein
MLGEHCARRKQAQHSRATCVKTTMRLILAFVVALAVPAVLGPNDLGPAQSCARAFGRSNAS